MLRTRQEAKFPRIHCQGYVCQSGSPTYLNDVFMLKLTKVLHFANGRHVQPVFKLAYFDLLDGHFPSCSNLSPCPSVSIRSALSVRVRLTSIHHCICTLSNLLILCPSRRIHINKFSWFKKGRSSPSLLPVGVCSLYSVHSGGAVTVRILAILASALNAAGYEWYIADNFFLVVFARLG